MHEVNNCIEYAPIIIALIMFALQARIFVTPEALEKKHREILNECQKRFAPIIYIDELELRLGEMKEKIDRIYDYFLENKNCK